MRSIFLFAIALFLTSTISFGQTSDDAVLLSINDKNVTKGEFMRIYLKNNTNSQVIDPKSLEEYLELFINFKLKVAEAEARGLDTTKAFIDELAGYRKQLAKPYLVNQDVDNQLMLEAYERLKYDVKASHILIKLNQNAAPADTLKAYNRILDVRKKALAGQDFATLAKKYSEDPSASKNGGSLGYFTGFQMVYPFESAAFNTSVGEISKPTRTRFGYHIVKVEDKRPAVGKVRVAHIMISVPENPTKAEIEKANAKVNNIYNQLVNGEASFSKLCRQFSDDKASAAKGGELPMFGTGKMVPEFEKAAFSLKKKGEMSQPIKTAYGYHIIKLLEKVGIEPYDEMKNELKSRIQRDSRSEKSKDALIQQLKKEYNYTGNHKVISNYHKYVTDSVLFGRWDGLSAKDRKDPMFTLAGKSFTEDQFTKFLVRKQYLVQNKDVKEYVSDMFKLWSKDEIINYENSRLEEKYPDFRYLMNEYHDGILLFELSDKMVWTKAVKDTVGLKNYYEKHKSEFMWEKRIDMSVYTLNHKTDTTPSLEKDYLEPNIKALKKVRKIATKRAKKNWDEDYTLSLMDKAIAKYGSNYHVTIEDLVVEKDGHYLAERVDWTPGISDSFSENGETIFVYTNGTIEPQPKELKEIKGLITADYQNFLEEKWIQDLRSKYEVVIHENVLKSIE